MATCSQCALVFAVAPVLFAGGLVMVSSDLLGVGGPPEEIRVRAYRTDILPNFELAERKGGPPAKVGVHHGPDGLEEERLAAEQTGERAGIVADL